MLKTYDKFLLYDYVKRKVSTGSEYKKVRNLVTSAQLENKCVICTQLFNCIQCHIEVLSARHLWNVSPFSAISLWSSPFGEEHLVFGLIIFIIIFLFRHFFEVPYFLQITIYQRDIWHMISDRQKPFHLEGHALNHTQLRSYPPFYEKPCYQRFSETVRNIDLKPFARYLLTLSHLSRNDLTIPYRSYFPFNIWCKFYIGITEEPEVIETWGLLIRDPWPLTLKIRSRSKVNPCENEEGIPWTSLE